MENKKLIGKCKHCGTTRNLEYHTPKNTHYKKFLLCNKCHVDLHLSYESKLLDIHDDFFNKNKF